MKKSVTCNDANAGYILRRNLPIWRASETIGETIAFCRAARIGEVAWKVDCEDFNHGFTPLALINQFLPWLLEARRQCTDNGIAFSINPWTTLGFGNRGRYPDGPPAGFHWRVRPDGQAATEMACPLSDGWRTWFLEALRLYATTHPAKLWLEDDFKTFEHGGCEIGCYCRHHLERFAAITGREISREALIARLTRPGAPDPIRSQWFDFQGAIMVEVCRLAEKTVHSKSPATRLGLMCSWSTDGRWWNEATRALAGPLRPLARTSLAPYQECTARDVLPDRADLLKEMACLGDETENCPELENFPHSLYSKSRAAARMQILMSQLAGNRSVTMNLFDFVGTPISASGDWSAMLGELKPVLDGLASLHLNQGTARGVAIPFDPTYADHVHADPARGFGSFWFDGDGWALPLQGSGVPIVINGTGAVRALTGQTLRAFSKEQISGFLGGGLLIDGSAAQVLVDMGFGDQIGITHLRRVEYFSQPLSAEQVGAATESAVEPPTFMCLQGATREHPGYLYRLECVAGVETASSFVDPDREVLMPALVLHQNSLGGRVAVYPFDLSEGIGFGFMNRQGENSFSTPSSGWDTAMWICVSTAAHGCCRCVATIRTAWSWQCSIWTWTRGRR